MENAIFEILRDYSDRPMLSPPNALNTCSLHFHRQLEVLYVTEGSNLVTVNSKEKLLTKDEMCIANSFDTHSFENQGDSLSIALIIPYGRLYKFIKFFNEKKLSANFITDKQITAKFKIILDQLAEHWNCGTPLLLEGLFDTFLGLILKYIPLEESKKSNFNDITHKILYYMESNYNKNLTSGEVASYFGYSKFHFSTTFNKLLHCHFNEYLNMLRVRQTIRLLNNGNINILDAVLDAGFTSIPTFYRAFKRMYKTNPTNFLLSSKSTMLEDLSRFTQFELDKPE